MRISRALVPAVVALMLLNACQPSAQVQPAANRPSPIPTAEPSASPLPSPPAKHIFVIVLENASYQAALQQPSTNSLATLYGAATNYHEPEPAELPGDDVGIDLGHS